MQRFINVAAALALLFTALPGRPAAAQSLAQIPAGNDWTPVDPSVSGVDYRRFDLEGPVVVHVARFNTGQPDLVIESALNNGALRKDYQTPSGMAAHYDGALNNWPLVANEYWGNRNQVLVAINGSYAREITGLPDGGQVLSGWYLKRYAAVGSELASEGSSGFVWTLNRQAQIRSCVDYNKNRQFIKTANGATQVIDVVNLTRPAGQLALYTNQYHDSTRTSDDGGEVVVRLERPALIMPTPSSVAGVVTEIRAGQGNTPIPFDSVVLSASGSAWNTLSANVSLGGRIEISQEITDLGPDCQAPNTFNWTKAYAAIQGSPVILRAGQLVVPSDSNKLKEFTEILHPRTAVAIGPGYVYFIVADGRQPDYSIGLTLQDLALFARDQLGATDVVNQDGGGSSSMVLNGQVVNSPVGLCSLSYQLFLPAVISGLENDASAPPPDETAEPAASSVYTCERAVVNGLMMVRVLPAERSNAYSVGQSVPLPAPAQLRLGPGDNYGSLDLLSTAQTVEIVDDAHNLSGILAKGSYWWKIRTASGEEGWVTLPTP